MGIIDTLLSFVPISDRTEIQFHRVHTVTPDGERQMITYITGEIVEEPTIVGSTADLEVPTDTVLIEHDDKQKYTEINGSPYLVYEYTTHPPSEVPPDVTTKPLPVNLRGLSVPKHELSMDEIDTIREILP